MPFCPDRLVYCGVEPLEIKSLKDNAPFVKYQKKFSGPPRVVIYNRHIFFIAQDLKKAKEMEDVFKFHILTLNATKGKVDFLNDDEISYLSSWEAERYRQKYKG
jgi:hypothetical protein